MIPLDTVWCEHHGLQLVEGVRSSEHVDEAAYVSGHLACECKASFVGAADRWPESRPIRTRKDRPAG